MRQPLGPTAVEEVKEEGPNYAALLNVLQTTAEGQSELLRAILPEDLFQLMLLQQSQPQPQNSEPIDLSDPSRINPDRMTYEQLLELEEKMGRVSKGLSTEQVKVFLSDFFFLWKIGLRTEREKPPFRP